MDLGLKNESRLFPQISLSQIAKYSSLVQPFSLVCTKIPGGNFSFGIVFFKYNHWWKFSATRIHRKNHCEVVPSAPVVIIFTFSVPFDLTVKLLGISKLIGTSYVHVSNLIFFYANNFLANKKLKKFNGLLPVYRQALTNRSNSLHTKLISMHKPIAHWWLSLKSSIFSCLTIEKALSFIEVEETRLLLCLKLNTQAFN